MNLQFCTFLRFWIVVAHNISYFAGQPILGNDNSELANRYSPLGTRYSELGTRYSVLGTRNSQHRPPFSLKPINGTQMTQIASQARIFKDFYLFFFEWLKDDTDCFAKLIFTDLSLVIRNSLLATRYSELGTRNSLLGTHYSVLATRN
jgi:hypothetical protein